MKCRCDWAVAKRPAATSPSAKECQVCAASFVPTRSSRERCSRACDLAHARVKALEAALEKHRAEARQIACEECQCEFCPLYGLGSTTLCAPCAEQRSRAQKRANRLKRKAVQRGATAEPVDPFKVFDRDGWRCKLCGVRTPKEKRGTYDDRAPELDHIIPLSVGGEHSYRNTQCACRKCNAEKSDRPLGQLLLIG
ncbi:HNH endonuclease [Massilia sp. CFBP 13647]